VRAMKTLDGLEGKAPMRGHDGSGWDVLTKIAGIRELRLTSLVEGSPRETNIDCRPDPIRRLLAV
jgi:hypothetical protein